MAQATLLHASDVLLAAKKVRDAKFNELTSKIAPVIEQLNDRMTKSIAEGKLFIELTQEEIETVPDTDASLFVGFLQSRGFTLVPLHGQKYGLYFYNPHEETA